MLASRIAPIVCAALTAACAPALAGCVVEEAPPAVAGDGYTPLTYDGYVVYYDAAGQPFYYADGVATWVPRGYAHYDRYVSHYRANWRRYNTWYSRGGYRYRTFHHRG